MKFWKPKLKLLTIAIFLFFLDSSCGSNRITFSKVDFFRKKDKNTIHISSNEKDGKNTFQTPDERTRDPSFQAIKEEQKENDFGIPNAVIKVNPVLNRITETKDIRSEQQRSSVQRKRPEFIKDPAVRKEIEKAIPKEISKTEIGYFVLAILLPFFAVGFVTDWDLTMVMVSIGMILCLWIPAVLYAVL